MANNQNNSSFMLGKSYLVNEKNWQPKQQTGTQPGRSQSVKRTIRSILDSVSSEDEQLNSCINYNNNNRSIRYENRQ